MFACEKKEKASQYKGVTWNKETRTWKVQLKLKKEKVKYGGYCKDELDAAKRVNQLCEELGIPLQNPEISGMPNQKYEVTYSEKIITVKIYFSIFGQIVFFCNSKLPVLYL